MCGIAGVVMGTGRSREAARPLLERMCSQLVHRGPDDEGYHVDEHVGLAQRRLSIIDLATGKQPMANEDGTVWVTFNGEIYNFHELRRRLEGLGHRFATHSDTEVIVHAYEQYGPECVRHLRGMFAFGVWDQPRRTLLLARDRVGKKPLFYALTGNQLLFASEIPALLQHPDIAREPSLVAIDDYLTHGYIPAPATIFPQIRKLLPAHYLVCRVGPDGVNANDIRIERYWQLAYGPKWTMSEEEAVAELVARLTEAVRLRLIADVPLGALLSGGVDSSLIVALMSRLCARPVKTFSIGFEERGFDELPFARKVAERYGTEHHELIVRPDAAAALPVLVRHYGEPFADSSALPSYFVAKLTREHVKVALNGDGGDESFAGYDRYLGSAWADRLRRLPAPLRTAGRFLAAIIPKSLSRRNRLGQVKRLLQSAALPTGLRYLRWLSYLSPAQKADVYSADMAGELAGHEAEAWMLAEYDAVSQDSEALDALQALDVRTYLPNDLLVKMDIATMACSLEARSPLLDQEVMEFAARLPVGLKMRRATLKYLLKEAAAPLLPAENMQRRKMGFGVPVSAWMRAELRPLLEDCLLSPAARTAGYFRAEPLRRLVAEHVQGRRDHGQQLWALLWLELWHREFLR